MAVPTLTTTLLIFSLHLLLISVSCSDDHVQTFIIRVHHDSKPSIFPTHIHWYQSSLQSLSPTPATQLIIHTYDTVFHGFSAKLSPLQAQKLRSLSGILVVIPEQVRQLHTTRSPQFLGLKTTDSAGLLRESDFGSDLVIGVIDTDIWPERQSFNDCRPPGKAPVFRPKDSPQLPATVN